MTRLRKYILAAAAGLAVISAGAKPSVLRVPDMKADSIIVYPESVETDVNRMMNNWYLQTYTALDKDVDSRPDAVTTDQEIIDRLQSIPTTMEMPFNSVVRRYIDMYTGRRRSLVESMLGMSLYYLPIFEQALEREGVPVELRYLPVIESAMDPNAVSRAGAVGLWQIMLPTARGLGLEINTMVDERRDPIRSSEAAAKYLRQLYDIYSDWSLAIAAYNCGPGNVNKAMRRAGEGDGKKDFWAIYPYLPQETRGYVPCFIAATYVMNFYHKHNISPALAKRPIVTDSVHVNKRVHFQQIADVLHIPLEELQILNPQYRKDIIPGTAETPCPLVLPANQVCAYVMSEDAILAHNAELYARRDVVEPATGLEARRDVVDGQEGEWVVTEQVQYHKVRRKETMASIARHYGVSLTALKRANGNIRKPRRGQKLKIVTTKRVFKPYENTPEVAPDDQLLVKSPAQDGAAAVAAGELVAEAAEAKALEQGVEGLEQSAEEVVKEVADVAAAEEAADEVVAKEAVEDQADESAGEAGEAEGAEVADEANEAGERISGAFASAKAKREAEAARAKREAAEREAAEKAERDARVKADKAAKAKADKAKAKKNSKPRTHTVKKGETLSKIAERNGMTLKQLKRLNPGVKASRIKPGDKIKLK